MNIVGAGVAFLAGMGSIASPCVLPLIPAYLTYLGGMAGSGGHGPSSHDRWRLFGHALGFVAGFSLVFILFGLSATAVGLILLRHQLWIREAAGIIVVLFGLQLTGVFHLPFLEREWRWLLPNMSPATETHTPSWGQSVFLGVSFSAGWTACVGPVLASILTLAAETANWGQGALLLTWYSLGLAVPFLAMALGVTRLRPVLQRFQPWLPRIQTASGILLVGLGVMIFLGIFQRLSALFSPYAF